MYRTIEPYTPGLVEEDFYEETIHPEEEEEVIQPPITETDPQPSTIPAKPCSCQDKAGNAQKAWWMDAAITAVTVLAIIALIKMILK